MSTTERVKDGGVSIWDADVSDSEMREFTEQAYTNRLFNPLEDAAATDQLLALRETWRQEGKETIFTSGVYDIMHQNHVKFLQGMRAVAAPYIYGKRDAVREGKTWQDLSERQRRDYRHHVVAADLARLVVSVDGNKAVSRRKGHQVEKGNMERPVFGWSSRARSVADLHLPLDGVPHTVADAVTIHDNVEPALAGTPHAGIMEIGAALRPDVWCVFYESLDIIEALQRDATGTYADITAIIIANNGLHHDELVGALSTTSITGRIRGIGGTALAGVAFNGKH